MSTYWLCADERYLTDRIDFTATAGADDIAIPVVMIQTGNSRSPIYPGIYREPRVRTYSDKFGTPTTLTTVKEITFAAVLGGRSMNEIYAKWQRIESYFDRAQIAASPFPRGTGVVFVEQINDATALTFWDVISGVLTDVDMNIPGSIHFAAVVQLSVLPFSRGAAALGPADLSPRAVGTGASYYLPNVPGDAPGIFELSITDTSPPGHNISWAFVGRRSYPIMGQGDFTPWYQRNDVVFLSPAFQQVGLPVYSNGGPHDTGLFGVWAAIEDDTIVTLAPTNIQTNTSVGGVGTIPNGFIEAVLAPLDPGGQLGYISSRQIISLTNPDQTGNVQAFEDFERNNLNSFANLPTYNVTGAGSVGIAIVAATPPTPVIRGLYDMVFIANGDTTTGTVAEASISMLMPAMAGTNAQSIAYLLKPSFWAGAAATSTPLIPNPGTALVPGSTLVATTPIPPPAQPFVYDSNVTFSSGLPMAFQVTFTSQSIGSTQASLPPVNRIAARYQVVRVPAFPAGITAAIIWGNFPTLPGAPWNNLVVTAPGDYQFGPTYSQTGGPPPPTVNTTGISNIPAGTWYVGYTYSNQYGETQLSPPVPISLSQPGGLQAQVPTFPATATAARVYIAPPGGTYTLAGQAFGPPGSTPAAVQLTAGDGVTQPPGNNNTGTPPAHDTFPRFTWGSVQIVPSPYVNVFSVYRQPPTGSPVLIPNSNFTLSPGVVHTIGVSYVQEGATGVPNLSGTYEVVIDGGVFAKFSGVIGTDISIPIQATWGTNAIGNPSGVFNEAYLIDDISVFDEPLNPGFILSGSSASVGWTAAPNTSSVDLYYSITITGSAAAPVWYKLPGVGGSAGGSFTFTSTFTPGSEIVVGPPTAPPYATYAQLQARVGITQGSGVLPIRWLNKPIVRTRVANASTELVKLGEIELPPGAKGEYRDLDPWELEVWARAGGQRTAGLTVKGIALFPVDGDDEWGGIVAKAFGLQPPPFTSANLTWTIGTNRWGRPYAQLYGNGGKTLVGYADVNGALSVKYGDNIFVVLTGTDDGNGNFLFDGAQTMLLSSRYTPRNHFQIVESAVP